MTPRKKPRRRKWWKNRTLTACLLIGALLLCAVGCNHLQERRTAETYRRAVSLMDSGEYATARSYFSELSGKDYLDTEAYLAWCKSMEYREKEMPYLAQDTMHGVAFHSMTEDQEAVLQEYLSTVEEEYAEACRLNEQKRRETYYRNLKKLVPYVGLPEQDISATSLGEPARIETHLINFRDYTDYFFEKNGVTIFAARCRDGTVTSVDDAREQESSSGREKPGSSRKTDRTDPFDAASYLHPEDFYHDYPDDFYDYEEAEDYYYAHGGK